MCEKGGGVEASAAQASAFYARAWQTKHEVACGHEKRLAMIGLMPIMWSIGTGADVMKRVAAPMVGGLATSFLLELLVYPAIYLLWKWHAEVKKTAEATSA